MVPMFGALTVSRGVLYVARPGARAWVRPYDFDGRALATGFRVRGLEGVRADLRALAADADRRIWAADAGSRAVRAFNVFGQELFLARDDDASNADRAGRFGQPVGIAAVGVEDETRLVVASAGERRHALHLVDPAARTALSLRPMGDPNASFRRLAGVAAAGRFAYACERGAGRVQVFRDGEFHFACHTTLAPGLRETFEPSAVAVLADGRLLVCHAGAHAAVLLFEAGGRFVRALATDGADDVELSEPSAIAIDEAFAAGAPRFAVLDQAGARVQVLSLEGRCFGSFQDPAHATV